MSFKICIQISLAVATLALNACSGPSSTSSAPAAAAAGGGGGAGGGTITGGSGGSAGLAMCPTGLTQYGASDIDLTLGGLNADLPAPSQDCLSATPDSTMCAALSLMVQGTAREIVCTTPSILAIDGSGFDCTSGGESVSVDTNHFGGATPPAKFALDQSVLPSPLLLILNQGTFGGLNDGAPSAAQVNGWVDKFYDQYYGCENTLFGVVAATWPDTGSGETRARGSFHARQF